MPRKARILSAIGIYHAVLRSVNQHLIFEEDDDYRKFLAFLSDSKIKYDIILYGYCLMDNHIHLLLGASADNLSVFFQSLGTRFARWYNRKYLRSGHLFQERYYSRPIENTSDFLATLVYIHNNPVKANICRFPSEYHWSSYNSYYGEKNSLISKENSFKIAGSEDILLHYFSICPNSVPFQEALLLQKHNNKRHFYTDEQALKIFLSETGLTSSSEIAYLSKKKRNDYIILFLKKGFTKKQVARLLDVSVTTVKRIEKMDH